MTTQKTLRLVALAVLLAGGSQAFAARTHTVQRGENLSEIADRFHVSVDDLVWINRLKDKNQIVRGQKLVIPEKIGADWTGAHIVKSGDTLSSIAAAYGVSTSDLAQANRLRDADLVKLNQSIKVPAKPPLAPTEATAPPSPPSGSTGETSAPARNGTAVHNVGKGETLSSIAAEHGVTVAEITRANNLRDADLLQLGQRLFIPGSNKVPQTQTVLPSEPITTHTVKVGETLSSIAAGHGVTVAAITRANNLRDADLLHRGQEIRIPGSTKARPSQPVTTPPAAPEPEKAASPDEVRSHIVKSGDTISTIAAEYGVTVRDLTRANHLKDADFVLKGQKLIIPQGATAFIEHRVAKGESLALIAARYQVAVADIKASNTLKNPSLIKPGQILKIPASDSALAEGEPTVQSAPKPAPNPRRSLPAAIQAAIKSARLKPGRWKHIVIHHSATDVGSGPGMDRYHREERHMEHGLAYHFVIGNGSGMREGAIFVGRRWNEQLDGGHLAIPALNKNSLGICLVGDFEKAPPSRKQLDVLEALVRALLDKTSIPKSAVTTHRLIHPKHTKCPGKYFPTKEFMRRLKES